MSASDAAPLPRLGEVFFDVRGDSRSMRLSWYADTGIAVFSIWHGGRCTGTFRLPIDDLQRMIDTLQRGPQQRRRPARDGRRPERADRQRPGNEPGYYGDGDYSDGDGGYDDLGLGASADHEDAHGEAGHQAGGYHEGGYGEAGHQAGGYHEGGYGEAGHQAGGYHEGGYGQAGQQAGGYHEGGYDDPGYDPGAQTQAVSRPHRQDAEGYGPDGYAPEGYGREGYEPTERASGSRPNRGHRAAGYADSNGYPDDPGYGDAPASESSRAGTSGSDAAAEGYWRYPDSYQPNESQADSHRSGYQTERYQSDGYETNGYQNDSYQPDGYQTAAYQASPTDHGMDAETPLAGYGEERFVPPYVHAQGGAYPNDNPAAGQSQWRGDSGPAYPADRRGVSAEPHRYASPSRTRPGYFEGSEDRLSADTPAGAPYSAGEHVSQQSQSYRRS